MHPQGPKGNYNYHTTAFDRAMEAGIDDVGGGVLYGLADPKFEAISILCMHKHLRRKIWSWFSYDIRSKNKNSRKCDLEMYHILLAMKMFKKLLQYLELQFHIQE